MLTSSLLPPGRPPSKSNTGRSRTSTRVWLMVITVACIHLICYKAASPLRLQQQHQLQRQQQQDHQVKVTPPSTDSIHHHSKRWIVDDSGNDRSSSDGDDQGGALLHWQQYWQAATRQQKPFLFAGMILWLFFLFAFVGITASDFFCPNLSTIASRLGMSESVAGVTFLAFSNGSPDVFSTFAALSHGSGSLAIGELIGAASFIVSVVAGTMCLIQPFRVARHTFLRDVGFFTVAITLTLLILWDSHIHLWEALGMVGLYLVYVLIVAVGSWWMSRKERRDALIRAARDEYADERGFRDEVPEQEGRRSGASTPQSQRSFILGGGAISPLPYSTPQTPMIGDGGPTTPALGHPHVHTPLDEDSFFAAAERGTPITLTRGRSGSQSRPALHRRAKTRSTVRPSLLGAIEFRDVVNSLREDSGARTLAVFGALGNEPHTHATFVGPEGEINDRMAAGRPRASSHSGALRLVEAAATVAAEDDEDGSRPPLAEGSAKGHGRRTTWTAAELASAAGSDESRPNWGESDTDDDEGRGRSDREGTLIDLSAGVENPWQNSEGRGATAAVGAGQKSAGHSRTGSRHSLQLDIPAVPSTAISSQARTRPSSALRRTPSGNTLDIDGKRIRKVPSIMLTSATGDEQLVQESAVIPVDEQPFTQRRAFRIARGICVALFPSMQDFWSKSIVGKATALLCVPAILLLNLTLPVVDSEADDCASLEEKEARDAEAAQLDSYRDYDSDEGEESGLQDSYFGPYDGLLVDTEDPEHPRDSHHPLSSQDARIRRELAAKALHNRVLPHAAANAISGAEIPSPWISTTPLETPSVADGLHHALAKFTFAAGDSFVDRSESRTGTPDAVDAPVTPKKGGSLTVSSAKLDVHADVLTRWLTAIQCTLGPVFCVTALLSDELVWWHPLVALAGGLCMGSFAFWVFEDRKHSGRIVLCFVGFFVAMVWILMIVNEVVGVLQTIGHIFGLSDAILGLTVFAVGNSLGDLVANATVARMGFPSMAIAACFGGPMLNILLGIGLSGSYMVIKNDYQPLKVHMGRTLLVSGVGLLLILVSTLILVPANGFWMNKKLGAGLILAYTIVLATNVCVEIWL